METEAAAEAGQTTGMPQLDFSSYPNQIFWAIIALVAIYFILDRVALPRIAGILGERRGTINNDISAAEEMKLKAQEAEEAYNRALADARADAQRIIAEARAEMQAELDKEQAKADAEIAARTAESEKRIAEIRDTAMQSVAEVARDTAGEIVEAMGYSADADTVSARVDARLGGHTA